LWRKLSSDPTCETLGKPLKDHHIKGARKIDFDANVPRRGPAAQARHYSPRSRRDRKRAKDTMELATGSDAGIHRGYRRRRCVHDPRCAKYTWHRRGACGGDTDAQYDLSEAELRRSLPRVGVSSHLGLSLVQWMQVPEQVPPGPGASPAAHPAPLGAYITAIVEGRTAAA
jgi:hypothetical protein